MKPKPTHNPGTLEQVFGNTATTRILEFLSIHREWDYNKKDIAKNSNVSPRHAIKAIDKLQHLELIKQTRTIGRNQMYQYNNQNGPAQLLEKFALELAFQECQKIADAEIAKEGQKASAPLAPKQQ